MPVRRLAAICAVLPLIAGLTACAELPSGTEPVGAIQVMPGELQLTLGDTTRLVATVTAPGGEPLEQRPVHWTSDDPRIVLVTPDGLVSAVGGGSTEVSVESGGERAAVPVTVTARFRTAAAAFFHSCGVTAAGRAACWGSNALGRLGNGTVFASANPQLVGATSRLRTISAARAHSCALDVEGRAYCWGANGSGQLGIGAPDPSASLLPRAVRSDVRFDTLVSGDRHTCGLTRAGEAYCWGGGFFGQLGVAQPETFCAPGGEPCNPAPRRVEFAERLGQISAGRDHTCGVTDGRDAYCWGMNGTGQLGDSTLMDRAVPTLVVGGLAFESIAAGGLHTCGVTVDGEGYCWGANIGGRLGIGTSPSITSVPLLVLGGNSFASITAGEDHTCGIATDGTAYCWGINTQGQLGIPGAATAYEPMQILGMKFNAASAGAAHTCAMGTDAILYCWGWNGTGQLGTPGPSRAVPTAVAGQ